jgi:hypothetical protein
MGYGRSAMICSFRLVCHSDAAKSERIAGLLPERIAGLLPWGGSGSIRFAPSGKDDNL